MSKNLKMGCLGRKPPLSARFEMDQNAIAIKTNQITDENKSTQFSINQLLFAN